MATLEARERRAPWILLSPALAAIAGLLVIPLMFIAVYSFWLRSAVGEDQVGFFLDNWQAVLSDPFYLYILGNTVKIAAITAGALRGDRLSGRLFRRALADAQQGAAAAAADPAVLGQLHHPHDVVDQHPRHLGRAQHRADVRSG
jgi:hypothetical protein